MTTARPRSGSTCGALRTNELSSLRAIRQAGRCHLPWAVDSGRTDVVRDRTLTSYPSVRTDLRNAGATVVDQEVCIDGNLITSRSPTDLHAFCQATDQFASTPAHTSTSRKTHSITRAEFVSGTAGFIT